MQICSVYTYIGNQHTASVKIADFELAVQLEHRQKYSDAWHQLSEHHLRTGALPPPSYW
jgi:hypothetical protein